MKFSTKRDFKVIVSFNLPDTSVSQMKRLLESSFGDKAPFEYFYHSTLWTVLIEEKCSAMLIEAIEEITDSPVIVIKKE